MAISLILRKYKIEVADDSVPARDLITFSLIDSWDISDSLMGDVIITRQLESDKVFNFAVSEVTLEVDNNTTLSTEFTRANLEEYSYEVQVYANEGDRRFVGQVDPNNITYNQDEQTWTIRARDWYKFFYDTLSSVAWNYLAGDLENYLKNTFGVEVGDEKFINFLNIDVPSDAGDTPWSDADTDIENLQTYKLLSRTDFLFEVIKHYGAFLYIDSDYRLNFVNRARRTPPISRYPIMDTMLDMATTRTFLRDSYYDALLISQKTITSPSSSEISWKLLRYVNGVLTVQTITDEDQIGQLQKGLRILDLRQKLGAIASGIYPDITYSWGYRMGYKLFPQREYEDALRDYYDLFRRPVLLETEIDTTLFNELYGVNPSLLMHIFYDAGDGNVEYTIEYIEEDLVREKMLIRAKEYFNPDVLPV